MARRSRKQRKLIRQEAKKLAADESAGSTAEERTIASQDNGGLGIAANQPQCPPNSPERKASAQVLQLLLGAPIWAFVCWAWSQCLGGVFNFYGGNPRVLYPAAGAFCLLLVVVCYLLRGILRWPKTTYALVGIGCIWVLGFTFRFVASKEHEQAVEASNRVEERGVITNIPDQFGRVNSGVSNVAHKIDEMGEKARPRHLNNEQLVGLVEALRLVPKEPLVVKSVMSDVEASHLRNELVAAFRHAGFGCSSATIFADDNLPKGVTVIDNTYPTPNPVVQESVKNALQAVGIKLSPTKAHPEAEPRKMYILVGGKPD